jgi:hypothetical protein
MRTTALWQDIYPILLVCSAERAVLKTFLRESVCLQEVNKYHSSKNCVQGSNFGVQGSDFGVQGSDFGV